MFNSMRFPVLNRAQKISIALISLILLAIGFHSLQEFVAVQAQNPVFGDSELETPQNYSEARADVNSQTN